MSKARRCTALTVLALAASLVLAATAGAYTTNGVAVAPYATNFPFSSANNLGPFGIAVDGSNRLFVTDAADGGLYRFSGPGSASGARIATISNSPGGLAVDGGGNLYVARASGDILQLNPSTGGTIRTVVSGLGCLFGLAVAPSTGDLYATDECNHDVVLVAGPSTATPSVNIVASGLSTPDGIAAARDGSVYFVDSGTISRLAPGTFARSVVANISTADGIALGGGQSPTFLIVNRNDGVITRVNFGGGTTDLVRGGSRGDFVAVGVDGCLYATQTNSVIRVTNPDGSCSNGGASTGLGGGLSTTAPVQVVPPSAIGLPRNVRCADKRGFRFTLHHAAGARVVLVLVYVNGHLRLRVHGTNLRHLRLRRLPHRRFVVRIVSIENTGLTIISTRTYHGCRKTRPHSITTHRHP
jgi:sugar lactone lactonase YvrE